MFIETIRCEGGKAFHLPYHQHRLNATLQKFAFYPHYTLSDRIAPPPKGLYRCRCVYDAHHFSCDYFPYTPKMIQKIGWIADETIDYGVKYADRTPFNDLLHRYSAYDEILIIQNGYLTDTTIANIALYVEGQWLTPHTPLLEGTTRARLVDEGKLFIAPLTPDDLPKATKIALMNAMIGFREMENGIILPINTRLG